MQLKQSYHKGILLWVDDNFIDRPFKKDQDIWENLFGKQSDKIYRLMDLELQIATDFDSGKKNLDKLAPEIECGTYVFCIFDIYLPRNEKNRNLISSDFGFRLAKYAFDKKIPFVFLSTASNITQRLISHGLTSVPFYQKQSQEQRMPETLIRFILNQFRTHIKWVRLDEIIDDLANESMLINYSPTNKNRLTDIYFPFFDSFRNYAERWELLPPLPKGTVVISRSPLEHCDNFIQQCLLIAICDIVLRYPKHVSLKYLASDDPHLLQHLRNENEDQIPVNAIRINTSKTLPNQFSELTKTIPANDNITFFILPNDESSDEYLNKIITQRKLIYEDLPFVSKGDNFSCETLLRESMSLVLHTQKFQIDDIETHAGSLYMKSPELLVHPLSWTILLDATLVIETLSDPYEIVDEIEKSFTEFRNKADKNTIAAIINNLPVNPHKLLNIGIETIKKDNSIDYEKILTSRWLPATLIQWLSYSWKFPYGLFGQNDQDSHDLTDNLREKWEDYSLSVLLLLNKQYKATDECPELNLVHRFLNHKFINQIVSGNIENIKDIQSDDLLSVKWPYNTYPLPLSLSKKINQAGCNFWINSQYLDISRCFPFARDKMQHLVELTDFYGLYINHIETQVQSLPEEWGFYINQFIDWIKNDKIKNLWQTQRLMVFQSLLDFFDNVLPIYYLSVNIWNGKFSNEKDKTEVYNDLYHCTGYGTIVNKIGGIRDKNFFIYIQPHYENFFTKLQIKAFDEFLETNYINLEYRKKIQRTLFIKELLRDNMFIKLYNKLENNKKDIITNIFGSTPASNNEWPKLLKNLDENKTDKLFEFLKEQKEFAELKKAVNTLHFSNDLWGIMYGFIEYIHNTFISVKHADADSNTNFDFFLKELSQYNRTIQSFELYEFGNTPFDVFMFSLNLLEKLKIWLMALNDFDGYNFLNKLRWVRNEGKNKPPENMNVQEIENLLRLLCTGMDAFAAQLKFLLYLMDEKQMADKIPLKYVKEIKLEKHEFIPAKNILSKFITIKKNNGKYNIFHLGIPGNETTGKHAICLKGRNYLLSNANELTTV